MGILIAIDGVDSSGKQTHTEMLSKRLSDAGYKVKRISFPDYESPSSSLVKMYLSGEFGDKPEDVNAYAASSFFAADRFASFRANWKFEYEEKDTVIIADRYTSSNMIHQASKLTNREEIDKFLKWLYELEFEIYGLPQPDITFFLDMPIEFGTKLMARRENKFDKNQQKDIHERNVAYLQKSYDNASYIAEKLKWKHIYCVDKNKIRSIQDINNELYDFAVEIIKNQLSL